MGSRSHWTCVPLDHDQMKFWDENRWAKALISKVNIWLRLWEYDYAHGEESRFIPNRCIIFKHILYWYRKSVLISENPKISNFWLWSPNNFACGAVVGLSVALISIFECHAGFIVINVQFKFQNDLVCQKNTVFSTTKIMASINDGIPSPWYTASKLKPPQ